MSATAEKKRKLEVRDMEQMNWGSKVDCFVKSDSRNAEQLHYLFHKYLLTWTSQKD